MHGVAAYAEVAIAKMEKMNMKRMMSVWLVGDGEEAALRFIYTKAIARSLARKYRRGFLETEHNDERSQRSLRHIMIADTQTNTRK